MTVSELLAFKDGRDTYRADFRVHKQPPSCEAIVQAASLDAMLRCQGRAPIGVVPTVEGGVAIVFESRLGNISGIEFDNDGDVIGFRNYTIGTHRQPSVGFLAKVSDGGAWWVLERMDRDYTDGATR